MPRIKQNKDKYATEDFRKEVRIRQGERDLMSVTALAEEAGMPRTTLTKRLSDPMSMTFDEFRKLNSATRLDPAVVLPLLGYTAKEIRMFRDRLGTQVQKVADA
jgi:DNA-binding phage protein